MKYNITDNYLDEKYISHLENRILRSGPDFQWLFQEQVAHGEDGADDAFYFVHEVYNHYFPQSAMHNELEHLYNLLNVNALIRCRIIMYVNQGRQIIHAPHVDFGYKHKAALLYMNDCNGYTLMANSDWDAANDHTFADDKGQKVDVLEYMKDKIFTNEEKVMSKRNRLLIHDGSRPHCSTTCTDSKKRYLIAVNYF